MIPKMSTSKLLLLTFLAVLGTSSVLALSCSNKFEFDYGSLTNFTDHMCAYCLDTMLRGHGKTYPEWQSATPNDNWRLNLTGGPLWGNQIRDHKTYDVIYTVYYEQLKAAVENNKTEEDMVLKEFSSDFYIVSLLD